MGTESSINEGMKKYEYIRNFDLEILRDEVSKVNQA